MEPRSAIIKVIGVGGGGCNAVDHMIAQGLHDVRFISVNTDAQALGNSSADLKIVLGPELTHGLGAGANPEIGRQAALEDEEQIREALHGTDMLFITAGMGGGTGTGAAPVIAQIAKEQGILTVAVVTKPFHFEGRMRMQIAEQGIFELTKNVDSLITIPNNKLLTVLGKNISLINAFKSANNVLYGAVQGISELITRPGLINVDFADVRTVMSETGMAMMGTGVAASAREAAQSAIECPLLEGVNIHGARGILVNITGGTDMNIGEFEDVGETIKSFITENATVVIGTVIDPTVKNEIRVTIVITGIGQGGEETTTATTNKFSVTADSSFEQPAFMRRRPIAAPTLNQHAASPMESIKSNNSQDELGYLNIPAFLRRQAKNKTTA